MATALSDSEIVKAYHEMAEMCRKLKSHGLVNFGVTFYITEDLRIGIKPIPFKMDHKKIVEESRADLKILRALANRAGTHVYTGAKTWRGCDFVKLVDAIESLLDRELDRLEHPELNDTPYNALSIVYLTKVMADTVRVLNGWGYFFKLPGGRFRFLEEYAKRVRDENKLYKMTKDMSGQVELIIAHDDIWTKDPGNASILQYMRNAVENRVAEAIRACFTYALAQTYGS